MTAPVPPTPQGGTPAAPATPAPAAVVVTSQERDDFVTRLIGQHGSVNAALNRLAGEQLRYRKRAQAAEDRANALQAKMPAADAVVLVGDEAKAYVELKAKGFTLDKVPARLTALGELESKHKLSTRKSDLKVASGTKYDQKVLATLLGETPLEFQTVNVMKEDKSGIEQVQVPYVVLGQGDKAVREALDTYLEREHKGFMEILVRKEGDEAGDASDSSTITTPTMPRQITSAPVPGTKGKAGEILKVVDRSMGQFLSPAMRRKADAGETK